MDATLPDSLDVLIIGGGVAGGGLATTLARAGYGVVVVERAPVFLDRIRGETVHPWGVRELQRAGLLDTALARAAGRILPFWTKYHGTEAGDPYRWIDDFPDITGSLSVQHANLQQALLDEAEAAGATILRPATITDITWHDERPEIVVTSGSTTTTFRPKLLVGADGTQSRTRRFLGGIGVTDLPHHAIGGTLLGGVNLPQDSAHQAYFEGGFTMLFPQEGGTSRVYYVCSTETAQALQKADEPESLVARLGEALPDHAVSHVTGAGPTGFFPNSETLATVTHGPATVLIGDAAGSNDPSQGHGLSLVSRDIRDLTERLVDTQDWTTVPEQFAQQRHHDHGVLRAHAQWVAPLSTGTDPASAQMREQVARAREQDPTAGGFAAIFATGPAGLTADEQARRHFLGQDLQTARQS